MEMSPLIQLQEYLILTAEFVEDITSQLRLIQMPLICFIQMVKMLTDLNRVSMSCY